MSAPERIWAVTEPDDTSAQILGEVYAQQLPDGMVGDPVEYIRADKYIALKEAADELAEAVNNVKRAIGTVWALEARDKAISALARYREASQ
jgi:hypothetical protein